MALHTHDSLVIFGRMDPAERVFDRVHPIPCSSDAPHARIDCIHDAGFSSSALEFRRVAHANVRVWQQDDRDEIQRDRCECDVTG